MKPEVLKDVVEKTKELIASPTCCKEARAAAEAFLDAVGTDREAAQTQKYIAELEADIVTAKGLLAFASSEAGAGVFGAQAPEVARHAQELIDSGARYCDCPACAAVAAILEKKEEMLA